MAVAVEDAKTTQDPCRAPQWDAVGTQERGAVSWLEGGLRGEEEHRRSVPGRGVHQAVPG